MSAEAWRQTYSRSRKPRMRRRKREVEKNIESAERREAKKDIEKRTRDT